MKRDKIKDAWESHQPEMKMNNLCTDKVKPRKLEHWGAQCFPDHVHIVKQGLSMRRANVFPHCLDPTHMDNLQNACSNHKTGYC